MGKSAGKEHLWKAKKGLFIFLESLVILAAFTGIGFSCDFCIISQGFSPLETIQGAGIRINERYALLDEVYKGEEKVANPGAKEEYWTTEFTGFYAINEYLMLLAVVPYKKTSLDGHLHIEDDGEVELHPDKGELSGLGDASLMARYTFFMTHTIDSTTAMAGLLGIKFRFFLISSG